MPTSIVPQRAHEGKQISGTLLSDGPVVSLADAVCAGRPLVPSDLALAVVALHGPAGEHDFCFADAGTALVAGLAAEMARRQLAPGGNVSTPRRRHLGALAPALTTGRGTRR